MKEMDSADRTAERLQRVYADQLGWSLAPAGWPAGDVKQITAMMRHAQTDEPGRYEAPDATTWIWSDLHLGDAVSITAFERPFATPDEMDRAMMDAWYEQVHKNETIICLGDVTVDGSLLTHHQEWWRNAPGEKWLVLGNHDRDRDALRKVGFTKQYSMALCATDPSLALSHIPLRRVPPTAVNVHGHLHEGAEPTGRHINVAVEQIDYSPVGLTWVLDKARRR